MNGIFLTVLTWGLTISDPLMILWWLLLGSVQLRVGTKAGQNIKSGHRAPSNMPVSSALHLTPT
jgi:hypothetical protein